MLMRQEQQGQTMTRLFIVMVLCTLTACATQPIIDTQGKSMAQYDQDLADCRVIAEQVRTGQKVAVGAAAGAAIGAAIGAAVGDSGTAQRVTGAGAISGSAKGLGRGLNEKQRVIHNCLRNRGYAVLN